jgi:hypothetical protein
MELTMASLVMIRKDSLVRVIPMANPGLITIDQQRNSYPLIENPPDSSESGVFYIDILSEV